MQHTFYLFFLKFGQTVAHPWAPHDCGLTGALGHAACFLQKGRHHLGLVLWGGRQWGCFHLGFACRSGGSASKKKWRAACLAHCGVAMLPWAPQRPLGWPWAKPQCLPLARSGGHNQCYSDLLLHIKVPMIQIFELSTTSCEANRLS